MIYIVSCAYVFSVAVFMLKVTCVFTKNLIKTVISWLLKHLASAFVFLFVIRLQQV